MVVHRNFPVLFKVFGQVGIMHARYHLSFSDKEKGMRPAGVSQETVNGRSFALPFQGGNSNVVSSGEYNA